MAPSGKILFVDDEPLLLSTFRRQFQRKYDVAIAEGPEQGMRLVTAEGPFAVVVSDLKMPGMDGIQFLSWLRSVNNDTVRILLTGHGGMEAAIAAINKGNIFRFLNKPCPPEELEQALQDALHQHHLITAERELLEKTLQGALTMLGELLGLSNPAAFQRAARAAELMVEMATALEVDNRWEWRTAALLSQIGCLSLAPEVLDKLYKGVSLSALEQTMYDSHPVIGANLIRAIPRLEGVVAIVANQHRAFDGTGPGVEGLKGEQIPLGARALKLILDFDLLQQRNKGKPPKVLLARLAQSGGQYDPRILEALSQVAPEGSGGEVLVLNVVQLKQRMVLQADVLTRAEVLLVREGQVITGPLLERLYLFHRTVGVREPIPVLVPPEVR